MSSNSADPFDWTVDDVVKFLCYDKETPWSRSSSLPPRPNTASFEAALRENEITGEILLQDVDKDALRGDLGLKALGHRSSIMMAIRYLRGGSQKYRQSVSYAPRGDQTPGLTSPSPIYPRDTSPRQPSTETPIVQSTRVGAIPATPSADRPLNMAAISDTLRLGDRTERLSVVTLTGSQTEPVDIAQLNPSEQPKPEKPEPEHTLRHEEVVIDSHGRKRRRLNLNSPPKVESDSMSTLRLDKNIEASDWYMGPDVLTPGQIFYPLDAEQENERLFTITPSNLPAAQRCFVNKRLLHFYGQSPIELPPSEGRYERAIVPYNPSTANSRSDRFFTLYTTKQGAVSVTKERISDWPGLEERYKEDSGASSTETIKPSDPFAYLLEKYPVQQDTEDAYPLYGDSGSEGEFDEKTWQEMQEERDEPLPPRQGKLGPKKVEAIIKDCVAHYEKTWRQNQLPREEYKARNVWLAARRGKYVNQEVIALAKEITLLETRLQKLSEELHKTEFSTEAELRTQCQCLEHTVSRIQKQLWRISVLEQETCPPRMQAPPKPQAKPRQKSRDEESLESESESEAASVDSLDDFVVDDIEPLQKPLNSLQHPASPSSSDGDDDVISVSGTRRRTRGRPPRVFASDSPSPPRSVWEKSDIIDLTIDSPEPEELRIETPPLNPTEPDFRDTFTKTSVSPPPSLGSAEPSVQVKTEKKSRSSLPKVSDMDGIMLLDWALIEERQDRRRLLAKLIGCLSDEERGRLGDYILGYQYSNLTRLIRRALTTLKDSSVTVPGLDRLENGVIMRTASFYISWVRCMHFGLAGIKCKFVEEASDDLNSGGFVTYYDELYKRLKSCRTRNSNREEEAGFDADDEVQKVGPSDTPHKKRKREVKESQEAKVTQASARLRVAQQEKQRKRLEKRLQNTGISNDNPSHQAVSFKEPVIYLDPHIGLRVKPHQLNGVRFMWRELIEDKDQQGCLLAHTMGLGKTMQVISLLTTISQAASSDDPKVRKQVPNSFRRSQTLIICPSSLIDNWYDEFVMWSPENSPVGLVRQILPTQPLATRLEEISDWDSEGGVLLISYNIFRSWIINKGTEKRLPPLSDTEHEKVTKWLLEGPNIIVADEAHKMKNPSSAIFKAAMKFRSKSRIALTGSPLANNLVDYYTMVNWIADGYLGHMVEFKANYVEPIEQGLYLDSTYTERRKSLMRLQVLKQILGPKINRADITVLEGDLPPKVEFVLTVPLTEVQKVAYDSYAAFVLGGRTDEVGQAQLWSWLAVIGLCCNHPACFEEKLISRANDAAKKMGDAEAEPVPGDEPITDFELPNIATFVAEQQQHFAQVPDIMAIELSARAELMNSIVDESIRAGDKVLIFSMSLPTLNYIEHLMKTTNRRYSRLDGQTPISSRQASTKKFNSGDAKQVYLISTRAGGLGLNIPGANRVIIFDFSFSPYWEEQAVGRAYRLGQRKPVFVYRFLAGGTFEEIIHHKAIFKTQLSVRVVDKKNPVRVAQKKAGDYLFPVKPVPQQDTTEYLGKDPLVLDKILRRDTQRDERLIRSITLTQTFVKEGNEKLTEEEQKSVQEEFDDENLRRTDPAAYHQRIAARQMEQMRQHHNHLSSDPFPITVGQGIQVPNVPLSAHNIGPPALGPDMISNPNPNPNNNTPLSAATSLPAYRALASGQYIPTDPRPSQGAGNHAHPSQQPWKATTAFASRPGIGVMGNQNSGNRQVSTSKLHQEQQENQEAVSKQHATLPGGSVAPFQSDTAIVEPPKTNSEATVAVSAQVTTSSDDQTDPSNVSTGRQTNSCSNQ
ncbi:P-loop containing nucleoside triphosphate hydrolase protein [Aspergillus carlsbadensis]|nr:P-loop containing nucleoside triphosphate hydrolase protein [Aspergillus carlsbadensis]